MNWITNQNYLKGEQYHKGDRLSARILLHEKFSTNHYGWFRFVFDHLPVKPGMKVLEVGCGTGAFWQEAVEKFPGDASIVLSDLSIGMVREVKGFLGEDNRFDFTSLDAQAFSFPDASFDLVMANHMLYHVPDMSLALREFRRVLKSGGSLCAATNGASHMKELHNLVQEIVIIPKGPDIVSNRFGLENGAEVLGDYFDDVAIHPYIDALDVTDADILVDYVASMWGYMGFMDENQFDQFKELVKQRIERDGRIHIPKSSGVFLARAG